GVGGVAERVEDGGDVVGDVIGQGVDVLGGQHQIVGERPRPADTHRLVAVAELTAAGPAVAAVTAGDVALTGDSLPDRDALDFVAHRLDPAHELVPHHQRHGNRCLRPFVPFIDVDVGAADGGL